MSKILFLPLRLGAGLLSGVAVKRLYRRLWALIDDEDPPQADQRRAALPKLVLALVVEGALFRVAKGLADRGSRSAFARLTGSWPGEEQAKHE